MDDEDQPDSKRMHLYVSVGQNSSRSHKRDKQNKWISIAQKIQFLPIEITSLTDSALITPNIAS